MLISKGNDTNIYKLISKANFSVFYNILPPNHVILLILRYSILAVLKIRCLIVDYYKKFSFVEQKTNQHQRQTF